MLATAYAAAAATTTSTPLTTVFTPPSWCADMPYTSFLEAGGITTFWRDMYVPSIGSRVACYPSNYAAQHSPGVTAAYSPGVCPSGYDVASIVRRDSPAAETNYCCPIGMSFVAGGCQRIVTTPTSVVLELGTTSIVTTPFVAADWYIKVVWAYSDLDVFTPVSAPLLPRTTYSQYTVSTTGSSISDAFGLVSDPPASMTGSSSSGAIASPSADPTRSSSSSSSGTGSVPPESNNTASASSTSPSNLSKTAKAGVIAGSVIGGAVLALLLAIIAYLWRLKRRRESDTSTSTSGPEGPREDGPMYHHSAAHEVDGWQHVELAGAHSTQELPAKEHAQELPAKRFTQELSAYQHR